MAVPFLELHVSNIHAREEWRHHSYFSDKAKAIIVGFLYFSFDWNPKMEGGIGQYMRLMSI